jgi:hypothetical protein
MIRRIRSPAIIWVTAAALATASCGADSNEPVFSKADLPGFVASKPPLPTKTPWIDVTESDGDNRAISLAWYLDPGHPLPDEFRRTDFQFGYQTVWSADARRPYDYRTEAAFAFLFRRVSGARAALAALRRHMHKAFPNSRLLRANELRDGSFGLDASGPQQPAAFYFWRIGNVVFISQAWCEEKCRFLAVTQVAQTYADTLDANAKRKS